MSHCRFVIDWKRFIALLCALACISHASAQCYTIQNATTFVVDGGTFGASGLAAGDCLKQAIRDIPNNGTIRLRNTAPGTGPFFIVRAPAAGTQESDERTGLPFIDKTVTIEAFSAAASPLDAIITADTTGGNVPDYRLFLVRGGGGQLTLNRVTVQNGRSMTTGQTNGGGIKHDSLMPLTLTDCVIRNNTAGTRGGGIWSQNVCLFERVRFVNNIADPAGLPGNPGEQIRGGGFYHALGKPLNTQALVMTDCSFQCNRSTEEGGGIWLGGGYQRRLLRCTFDGNHADLAGGGMTANGTTFPPDSAPPSFAWLQLTECRFGGVTPGGTACGDVTYRAPNTSARDGGAVALFDNAQPVFVRCTFDNNRTTPIPTEIGRGGAIYMSSIGGNNTSLPRSAVFIESLFLRNQTFATGGTPTGDGGAVFIRESSSPYFLDCGFIENNSRRGGGMNVIGGSNPRMYNCVFSRNSVAGTGPQGSAIWTSASSPQLLHCSLLSPIGSPLVWLDTTSASPLQLTGSVVWGNGPGGANRAFGGAGVVRVNFVANPLVRSNPEASFSDLDDDQPSQFGDRAGELLFMGRPTGSTNINCDPLVANAAINDVHLTACSPAIDRASFSLATNRYLQIFSVPMATFGFRFIDVLGAPESDQSDWDYDDNFPPPQGAFHNDNSGPRPRNPRFQASGGPLGCEADMGADEFIRDLCDQVTLYCDPAADGAPPFAIATANARDPLARGEGCGPFCEGEQLCLRSTFEGLCPTGVTYQWYFMDDPGNNPQLCGPLMTAFTPIADNGRITGSTTPNLCFSALERCDTGCYRLVIRRPTCLGPATFYCPDLGRGVTTPLYCTDELIVEVCISIYQAPEIRVQPLPATVCLGGSQSICSTFAVPPGCEPICTWYRVVGARDPVNAPMFPVDDVPVCPLGAPLAGITCAETSLGNGLYNCCLTFNPAAFNHAGQYYLVVTCGSLLCSAQSDPAELRVIDPQPVVENAAVCVGGQQCLEQVAMLPALTPGSSYTYQWYRRAESDCLNTPCPVGDCTSGTPLTNSGAFSGVTTPILCISPAALSHRGCYYVVVGIDGPDADNLPDDGKCASASNCACLTVVDPQPTLTDRAVCLGGTQSITLSATLPTLPLNYFYRYQWFFTGTADCGAAGCGTARPCATGTALTNGARPSGTVVSGATTDTLTLSNTQLAERGCYYVRVRIDGPESDAIDLAKCERFSNCACLTVVNPAPVIANAAVCVGGRQCLEVSTLPTLPSGYAYTYQWFRQASSDCLAAPCASGTCGSGTVVNNGGGFSGATTSALCIDPAALSHAGCYYVQVGIDGPDEDNLPEAGKCVRISNCACLVVVNPLPTIAARSVCRGGAQTLGITNTLPNLPANYNYRYQWFLVPGTGNCPAGGCGTGCPGTSDIQLANGARPSGTVVAGATTPNLMLSNVQAAEQGCYYVRVTIDGPEDDATDLVKCLRFSNCACLTVIDPMPVLTNRAVCVGGLQTLTISPALPSPPAGYTYYYKWFFIANANCLTNGCTPCGSGTQIFNGTRPSGTTVAGAGTASTSGLPTLTLGNVQAAEAGCWYVVVGLDGPDADALEDAGKCTAQSNCACLTVVNPQPAVTGRVVCVGGSQQLQVNSGSFPALPGGYSYTYQWYFVGNADCLANPCPGGACSGGSALSNVAPYSGVTTATLMITNAQAANQGCYYVVVGLDGPGGPEQDGPKCSKFSNCACLRVVTQPTFTVQPHDAAVCVGGRQTLTAAVNNPTGLPLCLQWYRKARCDLQGEGTPVVDGSGISGAMTTTLVFDPAALIHEGCYYLRARICNPDDPNKCPWVDSACACLDVRPPLSPCVLDCTSGETDAQGRCLFCPGVDISLCCDIIGAEGPLCYQWQFCPTPGPSTCFVDIPNATGRCFIIEDFNPAIHTGCYRVRINYLDLAGVNCPDSSGKCNAVYSLPLCVAETSRCCPETCDCKNNSDPLQPFYALWKTGDWDGINGEWSYDRSAVDGVVIKAADDFFLDQSCMHHITRFLGELLVRQSNPLNEFQAKLYIYEDCNGAPGRQIAQFDSDCPAFVSGAPNGFSRYQVKFDLSNRCFWLRGGIYWASLVAIAPSQDTTFEASWATVGLPGTPPTPIVKGRRPVFMNGADPWSEFDPCCHPCSDLQFCLSGKTCPIIWDNGAPFLGGADAPTPPAPPFQVQGTRSEKSTLTVRNSRAADQFTITTCATEDICYLEGYIFTNCTGFEVHLEIYENDCRKPQFMLPAALPVYYARIADPANVIDLGYTGLRVGTTPVRAYKVIFCDWPTPLIFEAGRNYWISLSVRDSFTVNERAFFAHVKQSCDPCTTPTVWKIDPGMEIAPGRQIPNWQSAGADFAFLFASKKPVDALLVSPPPAAPCWVDLNYNDTVDVPDLFLFLSAWFSGCP